MVNKCFAANPSTDYITDEKEPSFLFLVETDILEDTLELNRYILRIAKIGNQQSILLFVLNILKVNLRD